MESTNQVQQLFSRAIQTFTTDSSVSEIYVFGSYEKEIHDRYSDVDLHVVSQNFDATMSRLADYLSNIDRVLVAFPLTAEPGYAAYMVLFEHYPLYTKLDINIADSTTNSFPFAQKTCVYRREPQPPYSPSTLLPTCFEEPLNTLYGYYLGAIRYMKYRQRGKHFTAYKFYRAQLDQTLLRHYQTATSDISVERLGTLEYQCLDACSESSELKRYLYPANEHEMDALYIELLQQLTHEFAASYNEHHQKVFQFILTFLKQESRSTTPL